MQQKLSALQANLKRYSQQPAPQRPDAPPVIWSKGAARLLDYGADMAMPARAYVLVVPSLINRYDVLDLSADHSFMRYLVAQGIYPLLLDWGEPGEAEYDMDMAGYVQHYVLEALAFAHRCTGQKQHVLGYCLGGVLALAAAQLAPEKMHSLGLLATPWDYHSDDQHAATLNEGQLEWLKSMFAQQPILPAMVLQWLFALRQPFAYGEKFLKYDQLKTASQREHFARIEQWLASGVAMSTPAAIDCLVHWAGENQLPEGRWQVAGQAIHPAHIRCPSFVAIPKRDIIVPHGSAMALASQLSHTTICQPEAGHVGMVAGRKAKQCLWQPYVNYIATQQR